MALNTTTSITDYLKSQNKASDFGSRKSMYSSSGLAQRLGVYIGSAQQNTALLNYFNTQPITQTPSPTITQTPTNYPIESGTFLSATSGTPTINQPSTPLNASPTNPYSAIVNRLPYQTSSPAKSGNEFINNLNATSTKNAELLNNAQELQKLEEPTPTFTPEPSSGSNYSYSDFARNHPELDSQISDINDRATMNATEETPTPTESTTSLGTPSKELIEQAQIPLPSFAAILSDLSGPQGIGGIESVDVAVANEAKRLALEGEDTKLAKALSDTQKNMAKAGMSFSGIRTAEEQSLAAQSLANKTGISNQFASALISAAKSEYESREKAVLAQQEAGRKALETMGYAIDPLTGTLTKTLERQKMEQGNTQPTSYREWELAGKEQGTGLDYGDWLKEQKSNPVLDALRTLTYNQTLSEQTPSPGQLVSSATGLPPTKIDATTLQKVSGLISFVKENVDSPDGIISQIKGFLSDPDVDIEGKKIQFDAYNKLGGYLGQYGTFGLNDKEIQLAELIKLAGTEYIYTRSGAQVNESEFKRLKANIPEFGFSKEVNNIRVNNFINTLNSMVKSRLEISGLEPYNPNKKYGVNSGGQGQDGMSDEQAYQEYLRMQ
jgi:hypothetical protein